MLSKSCVYALRSIVYIGHNSTETHKISIKELGEELELPFHFLSKILQRLVKHHIIKSTKGPNGGFYISEEAQQQSILKIVNVIDGLSFFESCGLGLKACSETHPCPLHNDFKIFRDGLYHVFSKKTIADLVSKIEEGNAFINNLSSK